MNGWANGRCAPMIAAIVMMLLATPSLACDRTTGCPAGSTNTGNFLTNMLRTYTEAKPQTQNTAAPVNLRKFTKKQTRASRSASSRKARASKSSRNKQAIEKAAKRTTKGKAAREPTEPAKIAPALANANAELTEADAPATPADQAARTDAADTPSPAASTQPTATAEDEHAPSPGEKIDVVSADDFNEVDGTAWESNQPPRLMQFTSLDSRAEMHADDSKWSHTSTIGKIFVALGALLTIGSAIRMLIA